jgi:hypothetical protein
VRPLGKNWPQGFYKRYPELKAKRVKALDWARHKEGNGFGGAPVPIVGSVDAREQKDERARL